MKLREYENRFINGDLAGAILYIPNIMAHPMVLRFFSPGCAWFMEEQSTGVMKIIEIEAETLLDTEVIGWKGKTPLLEGHYVWLTNGQREKVTRVKEGDGSPYPIITEKGQYKRDEVTMVVKE